MSVTARVEAERILGFAPATVKPAASRVDNPEVPH
jgi:hypothetical protein